MTKHSQLIDSLISRIEVLERKVSDLQARSKPIGAARSPYESPYQPRKITG
jgi:hypothetical protein